MSDNRTMVKMIYGNQRKPRASTDCGVVVSQVEFADRFVYSTVDATTAAITELEADDDTDD